MHLVFTARACLFDTSFFVYFRYSLCTRQITRRLFNGNSSS